MSPRCLLTSIAVAAGLGATALPAAAQGPAATAQLVPARSEIAFTTRQMGVPVEGRFGRFTARIALDPKKPEGGSVALSIDTGSVRFGAAEVEAEVAKPGWLDAVRFPQATFQSTAIRALEPSRFEVAGRLSLKGTVRDVVVPVQLAASGGGNAVASGSFTLKRLEYKVGDGDWNDPALVADEVLVRFRLALSGLALP
jgi:polyisoprenoid-binding protein YceI